MLIYEVFKSYINGTYLLQLTERRLVISGKTELQNVNKLPPRYHVANHPGSA